MLKIMEKWKIRKDMEIYVFIVWKEYNMDVLIAKNFSVKIAKTCTLYMKIYRKKNLKNEW